jgi:outer membrane protein assembly factor BamB
MAGMIHGHELLDVAEELATFSIARNAVDGLAVVSQAMANPVKLVQLHEVPVGAYAATDSTLSLPGLSWELSIVEDGSVLEGLMPAALVGGLEIAARFQPAEAPDPPPVLVGASEPPAPAWTTRVDAEVWAGLAYDRRHGLLYVGADDGRVWSLDGRTGEVAWSKELGAPIRATPTLDDSCLLVVTDVALYALEAHTGDQVWSAALGEPLLPRLATAEPNARWDHYSSSAVVDGDLVVVGARDGCMHALERASGAQRWRTCTQDIVTSTPAITDRAVFFGGFDGSAYALSREDGSELWQFDTGAAIPRDAVLAGDDIVLLGSRSSYLFALDSATGEPVWKRYFWASWVDSPPVLREDVIYVGSSDLVAVLALEAPTGAELWSSTTPGWPWARVAVTHDIIYTGSVGIGHYWAPREPALLALDRQSGSLRWILRTERAEGSGMAGFGSAAVADNGRVFAVDLEGVVYAFDDP